MGGAKRYPSLSEGDGFRRAKLILRVHRFCLTGQITSCFPKWFVQPLLQKYFCSRLTQISSLSRAVLSHRGACARHERGAGCGGRGSVGRCQGMAGRVDKARELTNGTQTNDACCGLRSRVVLAPVAGVKSVEASRPNRADKTFIRGRRCQDEFV